MILSRTLRYFLFFTVCHWLGSFPSANALTKIQAYDQLRSSGNKWGLTKTLAEEAQAKSAEAQSELKPRFQMAFRQYAARINPIEFGGNEPQSIDTVGFGTTALEMSWVLMDPLAKAKVLSAEANEKMSVAQAKQYQNDLTALMLLQYLNVQRLNEQLQLTDANLKKSNLIFRLASAKKSVGAGIPIDIARAKNLVQLDQLKKISIYTKYTKARHELALLLNQEQGQPGDQADLNLEPLVVRRWISPEPKEVLAKTLDTRADLKSAELALEATQKAHDETTKMFFPKLTFLAEVGTTQPTLLGWPAKTMNGLIGLALSIPLETGGLVQAKRRETEILHSKAEFQFRQTRSEIVSQVKEALEQMMAAEEALKAAESYTKTSEEEASIAEKRYQSGASNILDLTNAHTSLATANDTRIENIYNYEAAKVAYFRTRGDFTEYFQLEKGVPFVDTYK